MRVLITGVAGLYGVHLVEELLSHEEVDMIYGVDDFSRGFPGEADFLYSKAWGPRFQLIKSKFQDLTVKKINSLNADVVVHLAGYNSAEESMNTPDEYFQNNEYGTFRFLQRLLRTQNQPYLICLSTVEVYGDHLYNPVDIDHPTRPKSVYAVTKLNMENYCLAQARRYQYPVSIIRSTSIYGENQNLCGYLAVVAAFIERACKGEPLIIYGTGGQSRDFLYVKDAVRAIYLMMTQKDTYLNKTVHLASGQLTAIKDLALLVKAVSGSESEIIHLPCEKNAIPGYALDIQELNATGWSPKFTLEQGLARTFI
ncbi:NAD-dependent epimerase/dehydratase family protein, partial [bacterium]